MRSFLPRLLVGGLTLLVFSAGWAAAQNLEFREQELPERLGVGYAVRLIDMNETK